MKKIVVILFVLLVCCKLSSNTTSNEGVTENHLYKAKEYYNNYHYEQAIREFLTVDGQTLKKLPYIDKRDYYYELADSYWMIASYEDALKYFRLALIETRINRDFESEVVCLYSISLTYMKLNKFDLAMELLLESLVAEREFGSIPLKVMILSAIGDLYYQLENYKLAKEYFVEALGNDIEHNLSFYLEIQSYLAMILYKNKQYTESLELNYELLDISELKDNWVRSNLLNNIGLNFFELENYKQAEESYLHSIKLKEEISENWGIANTLINLSELYIEMQDYEKADNSLIRSKKIILDIGSIDKEIEWELASSHLYKAMEEYDKAYEHYLRYSALKDSMFSVDKLSEIFKMEAAIRSEDSDLEYKELMKTYKFLEKGNNESTYLIWLFVVLATITTLIIVFQTRCIIFLIRDTNMKEFYKKRLLYPTEAMLEESRQNRERRRDILYGERFKKSDLKKKKTTEEFGLESQYTDEFEEPNYGVGNKLEENLLLLKEDLGNYVSYLKKIDKNAVSGVHNLLQKLHYLLEKIKFINLAKTDEMKEYKINTIIIDFAELIKVHVQEKSIKLIVQLSPEDPTILCNRDALEDVLINLFMNSSHAIKDNGEIKITTEVISKKVLIKFTDNGIGIPKQNLEKIWLSFYTTKKNGKGLGLARIKKVVADHNGKIYINSELNKWTEAAIELDRVDES